MNAKKAQKKRGYQIIKQKQNGWYAERQEEQKMKKFHLPCILGLCTISLPYSVYQFSAQAILCQAHGGWQNKEKKTRQKRRKKNI